MTDFDDGTELVSSSEFLISDDETEITFQTRIRRTDGGPVASSMTPHGLVLVLRNIIDQIAANAPGDRTGSVIAVKLTKEQLDEIWPD